MKRFLIRFLVLGLLAGSVATAEAKDKKKQPRRVERTVERAYECNPFGVWPPVCRWEPYTMPVETRETEGFFTAEVTDAHGQALFVEVYEAYYEDDKSHSRSLGTFCGKTSAPVSFHPGARLTFSIAVSAPSPSCLLGSSATTGTISVTLSNLQLGQPKAEPVRSGTIVSGSGWLPENQLGGCQTTPDCLAWLESDCDPGLAGREPGVMASIEDVGDIADGRTQREFRFGPGRPWAPVWGGVVVQFWGPECNEVANTRWRSTDCDGKGGDCLSTKFRIPASARWMTVTSYPDNVNLAWTLN